MKSFWSGIVIFSTILCFSGRLNGQDNLNTREELSAEEQSIFKIAALASKGDLSRLKPALESGLEAGLTINEIKEILVHLYAYSGFPRSIRGLQTFMEVLAERKDKGISDKMGNSASAISEAGSKYERGKEVLGTLTGLRQPDILTGYAAFSPTIDTFLKEHLFADIFERDILTYAQRELVTISVLSTIGGVAPMLRSHLRICLNVGLTPGQLQQFVQVIKPIIGSEKAGQAKKILDEVLKNRK